MTMQVTIHCVGPHEAVVNVCEHIGPGPDDFETTERHDLKPGENVTVQIYGWRKYCNVMEMAPREDAM